MPDIVEVRDSRHSACMVRSFLPCIPFSVALAGIGRLVSCELLDIELISTRMASLVIILAWKVLVSAALQMSNADCNVRFVSIKSRSLTRPSLTPNTILSRISLSFWSPKQHVAAFVRSSASH